MKYHFKIDYEAKKIVFKKGKLNAKILGGIQYLKHLGKFDFDVYESVIKFT